MRADGPVTYRALYQQWFILGYEEARQALTSTAMITSPQAETLLDVRPYSQLAPLSQEFFAGFLLFQDPPDHTRLRRLVSRSFTSRRVAELEPKVQTLADAAISNVKTKPSADLYQELCADLPVAVIGELLGLPSDRWRWSAAIIEKIVALLDPFRSFDPKAVDAAIAEAAEYWGDLADELRSNPTDGLLSALVATEVDGDRLSRMELIILIMFLMGAGHETTTNLMANSIINLARHPEQRQLVIDNPDLWPNAVEELIRFDTSVRSSPRHTVSEITIGDETIPKGSNVLVRLDSANRDPRRYDQPNELRLDRDDPSPLSFGQGIHHCIGHALARQELRVGLSAFISAFPDYQIDEEQLEWKKAIVLRGPAGIPFATLG